jgi:hypothetical protein
LCKLGYASGIAEARTFDARTVLQVLHYENFCDDYETTFMGLNK